MREIGLNETDDVSPRVGRYETFQLLGEGGTGRVYRARHPESGSIVAVKVLNKPLAQDEAQVAQFLAHAESMEAISHPGIAQVLDHGLAEDGRPYVVMESIDGPSLSDVVRKRVQMPWSKIAKHMLEAAEGLHAAARHDIVHGDIKPGNLLISVSGAIKIIDFTMHVGSLGTPSYTAPEKVLGQSADFRSDMYSLGATFYHLIAGQAPFEAETSQAVLRMHVEEPLLPLHVPNPEVPSDLAEVVHRLLGKTPADRYVSYEDLILTLRRVFLTREAKEKARSEAEQLRMLKDQASMPQPTGVTMTEARILEIKDHLPSQPSKPSPLWKTPFFLVIAITLLICLTIFLIRGRQWISLLSDAKPQAAAMSTREMVSFLRGNFDRMRIVSAATVEYTVKQKVHPLTPQNLVDSGLLQPEDILDVWDRPFAFYPVRQSVVSLGEDGIAHSSDDFEISEYGVVIRQPGLLSQDDSAR